MDLKLTETDPDPLPPPVVGGGGVTALPPAFAPVWMARALRAATVAVKVPPEATVILFQEMSVEKPLPVQRKTDTAAPEHDPVVLPVLITLQ